MPSAAPGHVVRYQYTYRKLAAGAPAYSGYVDIALNPGTLYYREYRNGQAFRDVLYNRNAPQVLLFNHPQNRLNLFSELPHDAVSFIPFPFQDEAVARLVDLTPVQKRAVSGGSRSASVPGTLGKGAQAVPVQFRAALTPSPSGLKVSAFSIHAPDGEVASWAFTYGGQTGAASLPTTITRLTGAPILMPEDRERVLRREVVPPTHWRPDAQVRYTFVSDRPGEAPSVASLLSRANEQTTVIDRRDLKNVVRFTYQKEGGDLEKQVAVAQAQAKSSSSKGGTMLLGRWLNAGGYGLILPFVLGTLFLVGGLWSVLRRGAPRKI